MSQTVAGRNKQNTYSIAVWRGFPPSFIVSHARRLRPAAPFATRKTEIKVHLHTPPAHAGMMNPLRSGKNHFSTRWGPHSATPGGMVLLLLHCINPLFCFCFRRDYLLPLGVGFPREWNRNEWMIYIWKMEEIQTGCLFGVFVNRFVNSYSFDGNYSENDGNFGWELPGAGGGSWWWWFRFCFHLLTRR